MARRPARPHADEEVNQPDETTEEAQSDTGEASDASEEADLSADEAGSPEPSEEGQAEPEPEDGESVTEEQLDLLDAEDSAAAVENAKASAKVFLSVLEAYSEDTPETFNIGGNVGAVLKLGDIKAIKPWLSATVDGEDDAPEITEEVKKAAADILKVAAGYPEGTLPDRSVGGNAGGTIRIETITGLYPVLFAIVHYDDMAKEEADE